MNDCTRLLSLWNFMPEGDRLEFLRAIGSPFPASTPVDSAKMALLNLTDLEWQEVQDWLGENHWLPPGVN